MLVKKQSRLDVRKYSFSQWTINVWNKLSTDCVHVSSVDMFKNKIDKYHVTRNEATDVYYTFKRCIEIITMHYNTIFKRAQITFSW